MKQVQFQIHHLEAFIKFFELTELNIVEKTIYWLTEEACVSVLISGKFYDSIDKAKEKYLIHNKTIISIYGAFDYTQNGINRLFYIKANNHTDELSKLEDMSKLYEVLESLNK